MQTTNYIGLGSDPRKEKELKKGKESGVVISRCRITENFYLQCHLFMYLTFIKVGGFVGIKKHKEYKLLKYTDDR